MDQCLRDMYMKGIISLEEAMLRCQNQDELKKMINLGGAAGGSTGSPQRR
jgi:twitching motility protein PilT